jgi:hypothetical protein
MDADGDVEWTRTVVRRWVNSVAGCPIRLVGKGAPVEKHQRGDGMTEYPEVAR